jgi:hypothetical protein
MHLQDALYALDLQASAVDREAVLALRKAAVWLAHLCRTISWQKGE